ncbi:MAG: CBS domain-containing protein [Candidatus Abyssobacteria bacterium SURF_5]|jgi:CBS domain-containing protein|uniref:CBS domain-containing protein n=1 Tax=Abyssobacteria bacterium (strain SURF_5) TaxID=2093360 RepID=A0A3A4NK62_ABYX5|nr:MAG: CBS domain-containing protein [Candidatus Abyssubacteria bacterium SURF_5]
MTRNVESIHQSDSIADAARKMKELNIGVLPVFDNNRLVGMITDRDITIRAVAEGYDPNTFNVSQIMTTDVISCNEDADVDEAIRLMETNQIRRLIVKNEENQVVGIVSLGDLAVHLSGALVGEALREVSEPARPER